MHPKVASDRHRAIDFDFTTENGVLQKHVISELNGGPITTCAWVTQKHFIAAQGAANHNFSESRFKQSQFGVVDLVGTRTERVVRISKNHFARLIERNNAQGAVGTRNRSRDVDIKTTQSNVFASGIYLA